MLGVRISPQALLLAQPHKLIEAPGIASIEALGVPELLTVVSPPGIASAEALGVPTLTNLLDSAWWNSLVSVTGNPASQWDKYSGVLPGLTLVQAVAGDRPVVTTDSGRQVLSFDGTSDYMVSNQAASVWAWLHAATGSSFACVFKPAVGVAGDDTIFDTVGRNAALVGMMLSHDATGRRFEWRVANGGGVWVFAVTTAAAQVTLGAWNTVIGAWDQATGYTIQVNDNAPSTGAVVGIASAADPAFTLRVGSQAHAVPQRFYGGMLGDLILCSGKVNMEPARAYLAAKWV